MFRSWDVEERGVWEFLHHDGNGTLVSDRSEPLDDTFLCAGPRKVPRHKT